MRKCAEGEITFRLGGGLRRQLHRYAADPTVPALAKDTRLHLILYQFKGAELIRCEDIPPACGQ